MRRPSDPRRAIGAMALGVVILLVAPPVRAAASGRDPRAAEALARGPGARRSERWIVHGTRVIALPSAGSASAPADLRGEDARAAADARGPRSPPGVETEEGSAP